jgi:hypothetical protein
MLQTRSFHNLEHLEQYRYKEKTPQEKIDMLARLRHNQAMTRARTFSKLHDEDAMESDTTPLHPPSATTSKQFVKPNSVHYHAFDVDQEMSLIMQRVVTTYPEGCSESLYQKAVLREAYLSGLPVMVEREVFTDYGNGSLLLGRVDMEVAGTCLYELKVGTPKIADHSKQLQKYLDGYDHNKENIQVAKLVYFMPNRVTTHVLRDATSAGLE